MEGRRMGTDLAPAPRDPPSLRVVVGSSGQLEKLAPTARGPEGGVGRLDTLMDLASSGCQQRQGNAPASARLVLILVHVRRTCKAFH